MPFVSPVTVIPLEVAVPTLAPGLEVAVYNVIALPPSSTGAVKFTVICPFPGVPVTAVGAPGTVAPAVEHFAKYIEALAPAVVKFPPT